MKKIRSNERDNEYCPLSEGDEVFVDLKTRRMRASVVALGSEVGMTDKFVIVEDCDERHYTVLADDCEKVCEGCDGYGSITYPARQAYSEAKGTYIEDEQEVTCRMCKGTGVPVGEDDYEPE